MTAKAKAQAASNTRWVRLLLLRSDEIEHSEAMGQRLECASTAGFTGLYAGQPETS